MSDDSVIFKIVVAGDQGVGKTTLIHKFVDGVFKGDTLSTIGVDFSLKTVIASDKSYVLQIWDVAGEERFRAILPHYIPGTEAVVLAFDSTRPFTLENLEEWIKVIEKAADKPGMRFILISTKNDLKPFNNAEKIKQFRSAHPEVIGYLPVSSKTGQNVEQAFQMLGSAILKKYGL